MGVMCYDKCISPDWQTEVQPCTVSDWFIRVYSSGLIKVKSVYLHNYVIVVFDQACRQADVIGAMFLVVYHFIQVIAIDLCNNSHDDWLRDDFVML